MFQKIINFIKYHNLFTIILGGVLLLTVSVFASETVRDAVIGQALVERQGIDNTALLAADLDNFDMAMQIDRVREDGKNYYVNYSYRMFAIVDNVWQETTTTDTLVVSVAALSGRDLGLYIAEELSEVIDDRLSYLREVQDLQQNQGLSLVQETTTYTGLIGLVLNPVTRELPGYVSVVSGPAVEPFVPIEGVDEAGERRAAAEEAAQQGYSEGGAPATSEESSGQTKGAPETILDTCSTYDVKQSCLTSGVVTTSTNAVFIFYADFASVSRSDIGNVTFQCQVNNNGWYPCDSPQNFINLTDGVYIFRVYVVAPDGTYDQTPAVYTWTIDTKTAPEPEPEPTPAPQPQPEPAGTTTESVIDGGTSTSTDAAATTTD